MYNTESKDLTGIGGLLSGFLYNIQNPIAAYGTDISDMAPQSPVISYFDEDLVHTFIDQLAPSSA